jgi:peroxiredoxin family protein
MAYGAGVAPYVAGTAGIGNRMEIFKTFDGLKYLWFNRHAAVENFRQLVFY